MIEYDSVVGVYKVGFDGSPYVYVGASTNLYWRYLNQKSSLRTRHHHNGRLQALWDEFGEKRFVFTVLELVDDPLCLPDKEFEWMSNYRPELLLNLLRRPTHLWKPHHDLRKIKNRPPRILVQP